jgi:protein-S-isoprenylcysteine O-methyltransferase Ste14
MTFKHPIITSVLYLITLISAAWQGSIPLILLAVVFLSLTYLADTRESRVERELRSLYDSYKRSNGGGGTGPR